MNAKGAAAILRAQFKTKQPVRGPYILSPEMDTGADCPTYTQTNQLYGDNIWWKRIQYV